MKLQHEIPPEWERENIRLYAEEAADREFARVAAECSSDSDLLRQAIRHTEQYVQDRLGGRRLFVRRSDDTEFEVLPGQFEDGSLLGASTMRRSLVLHRSTRPRLDFLARQLGLENDSTVARFALRFFSRLAAEIASGSRFFVADASGAQKEVRFGTFAVTPDMEAVGDGEEVRPSPRFSGMSAKPTRPDSTEHRAVLAAKVGFGRP